MRSGRTIRQRARALRRIRLKTPACAPLHREFGFLLDILLLVFGPLARAMDDSNNVYLVVEQVMMMRYDPSITSRMFTSFASGTT